MKPIIVLFLLIISLNISYSQDIVKANKKWEGTKFEYPSEDFQAKFRSEKTEINDKFYYELTYKVEGGWFEGVQQYYRQEDDKIYRLYNDVEKLIYDFALNVGDTIQVSNDEEQNFKFFPIRTTDTTIYNKTLRKLEMRVIPESTQVVSNAKHVWIEGVGDIAFFFGNGEVFNNQKASLIHCVKENVYFYSGPDQQCDGTVSTKETVRSTEDFYTYNALERSLTIVNNDIATVQLYSLTGQKIRSFTVTEKQKLLDLKFINQQLCVIVLQGSNVVFSEILML